jgi:hypothetical protein
MVSEKPPRHSKSNQEPVTIDLDPKDVTRSTDDSKAAKPASAPKAAPSEKPATSAATDKTAEPTKASAEPPKAPASSAAKSGESVGAAQWEKGPNVEFSNKGRNPTTASSVPLGKTETPGSSNQPKPSDTKPSAAPASSAKTDFGASRSTTSGASAPASKSSNSGSVAAGIIGGLIALVGAGSLQYAGYIPGVAPAADTGAIESLRSDIETLKASVASQPQQPAFDTSAIDGRLNALETATASPASIGVDGVDGLNTQLTNLQNELAALKTSLSEATTTNAALTERLTAAEEKINEPRDDIEIARAIAAAALKAAIDRGGPFLTELDTLVQITPEDEQLKSLQPFASTGVPSRTEILKGFPAEADAMLSLLNQPDPNLGLMDRLTQSAMSLVRVRPVGNIAGATPEAIIARVEDKIRNGDLKGASLEWDALPEEAKLASDGYKKSLDARIQVENLVGAAVTRALTKNADQG